MRFYWGLGVGHIYSHGEEESVGDGKEEMDVDQDEEESAEYIDMDDLVESDDQENEPWYDSSASSDGGADNYSDDNECLEMEDTYA